MAKAIPADQLARVWREYKETGDIDLRDQLLGHYSELPSLIAFAMIRKLSSLVDVDDLIQAGAIGLMKAVDNFDPSRDLQFSTYATTVIRGHMFDQLRNESWVPRLVMKAAKQIRVASETLVDELGREPTDQELADRLEVSLGRLAWLRKEAEILEIGSLDATKGECPSLAETFGELVDPAADLLRCDVWRKVCRCLAARDRLTLQLYYRDGLTMKQIGATLGVQESRVSQLLKQIIEQLRKALAPYRDDLLAA